MRVVRTGCTEAHEQFLLVRWLKIKKIRFFAIPNGGTRHPLEAKNLKSQGVVKGVPDLMIPMIRGKFHGMFIEMKRKVGGVISPEQKEWITYLNAQGYCAVVCKGFDDAKEKVEGYFS